MTRGPVRIEVNAQGRGPLIVLLPSLGRSGRDYDIVAARLAADGFRVLRPEPRGIGQSRGPMENLSIHDFAADVAAVVEAEGKGPVVVVGHAWGNFAARMLAADRPDLVKGVVIAAASAGKVPPGSNELPIGPEMRKAIDGAGDLSLPEAQRLEYLRIAFFAPGNDPKVWLRGWHRETHEAETHARDNTPVDDYFAAGTAPILDLQAEADNVAPRRFSQVLKSMLGDRVTVVVIPNAGHALAPEQPQAMADAIADFSRRVYGIARRPIKEQLVGTWAYVSSDAKMPDGGPMWGSNPKGLFIVTADGHFSWQMFRSDRPEYAGRLNATADEAKATMQGSLAYFGTYSVSEADKTITFHTDGSTFPHSEGETLKRVITTLTADELIYTNPATTTGAQIEAVWKRLK